MHLAQVVISLGFVVAFAPIARTDTGAPEHQQQQQHHHQQQPTAVTEEREAQCSAASACAFRQHSKQLRLQAIKSQILSKLRLKHAPNVSRDVVKQLLPKAPPVQQLLDLYDVLGDDGKPGAALQDEEEDDEEHATTETVMSMAAERKCSRSLHLLMNKFITFINAFYGTGISRKLQCALAHTLRIK